MDYVLLKEDRMHTPIIKYQREKRRVTSIGTFHIGTEEYYRVLQKRINRVELGFFEGLKHEELPAENTGKVKRVCTTNTLTERLAQCFGLVTQYRLTYPARWINADMNQDDFYGQAPETIKEFGKNQDLMEILEEAHQLFPRETKEFLKEMMKEEIKSRKDKTGNALWKEMIYNRNQFLFKTINPYIERAYDQEIVIIYGAGHTKGIDDFLVSKGFEKKEIEWIEAANLETKTPSYETIEQMERIIASLNRKSLNKDKENKTLSEITKRKKP